MTVWLYKEFIHLTAINLFWSGLSEIAEQSLSYKRRISDVFSYHEIKWILVESPIVQTLLIYTSELEIGIETSV